MLPEHWFLKPLFRGLRTITRPPTSLTRRRLLEVKVELPLQCFETFMRPLPESTAMGLTRKAGQLVHSSSTPGSAGTDYYTYLLDLPLDYDKIFCLEKANVSKHPRDKGCARVNLSVADEKKGHQATSSHTCVILVTHAAKRKQLPFGNVSMAC